MCFCCDIICMHTMDDHLICVGHGLQPWFMFIPFQNPNIMATEKSLWIDDHTQLLTMAHMGKPSIFIVISSFGPLRLKKIYLIASQYVNFT